MRVSVQMVAGGLIAAIAMGATASPLSLPNERPTAPLQPLGEWSSQPSATRCTIERSYGDRVDPISLAVHESLSGKFFEINIERSSNEHRQLEELPAAIYAGGAQIERWSLHSVSNGGTNTLSFGLTPPEMSRVSTAGTVSFRVNGKPDQSFTLSGLDDALRQLDQCTAQLRQIWRVDVPDGPVGIRGPRYDVRTAVARAAPSWRQLHIRPGNVRFIVLIDENGQVADCDVQESSGAPLLEELGCQLLRETVAVPARDRTGNAVRDSFRTPPIIFEN